MSPIEFISINKRLFGDIYDFAGSIREHNITKREWVLEGDTVLYANAHTLRSELNHELRQEKKFRCNVWEERSFMEHIGEFISNLWQIHPFYEGNTRTTAVFAIKYLKTFGYEVENDTFERHSLYFRNALVRANFSDNKKGVSATYEYLNKFLGNVLFNENNILRNRELHINAEVLLKEQKHNKEENDQSIS
jgi:fido (protein-threonine AMPylation protein)